MIPRTPPPGGRLPRILLVAIYLLLRLDHLTDASPSSASPPRPLRWYDARPFLRGNAFPSDVVANPYDRLPEFSKDSVTSEVWTLSRMTAGMYLEFRTRASALQVNATYLYENCVMYHFPSTGVCGLDLYAFDENASAWRWTSTTTHNAYPVSTNVLTSASVGARANDIVSYRLHLPLYNGIVELSLGADAEVLPASSSSSVRRSTASTTTTPPTTTTTSRRVVWYGTSIAQGGVASRPGTAFTNILSRAFSAEVYNFGFSGNGLMSLDVAEALVTIENVSAFVIDCNWNMNASLIAERAVPLVRYLRSHNAGGESVPIVLVEDTVAGAAWYDETLAETQRNKSESLRGAFDALRVEYPDDPMYYVPRGVLFNFTGVGYADGVLNPTVAGTHPTDLGMRAMSDYWESFFRSLWGGDEVWVGDDAWDGGDSETSAGAMGSKSTATTTTTTPLTWTSVAASALPVVGRANFSGAAFEGYFERLPLAAKTGGPRSRPSEGPLRDPVWNLSQYSTGIGVVFTTRAPSVYVNYTLRHDADPLWHMPATGTSGLDLFAYDSETAYYRFVGSTATSTPRAGEPSGAIRMSSSGSPSSTARRYWLYLPMRNTIESLSIGVSSEFADVRFDDETFSRDGVTMNGRKPIVWYGTSIVQGGAVSRPGSSYVNVLSRELSRVVLNFGFAGNGMMELSVAQWLLEVDAALYVVDCLPNMSPELVTERTAPLVRYLRNATRAPILLVAGSTYGDHWILPEANDAKRAALREAYDSLVQGEDAVSDLHLFLNAKDELFLSDELVNPTVGGTHPSDLGDREIAVFYRSFLRGMLGGER